MFINGYKLNSCQFSQPCCRSVIMKVPGPQLSGALENHKIITSQDTSGTSLEI